MRRAIPQSLLSVHPAYLVILPLLALLIVMSAPRDPLPSRVEPPIKAAAKLMSEGDLLHRGPTVATPFVEGLAGRFPDRAGACLLHGTVVRVRVRRT
jgi:hypothetical protein